MVVNWVVLFDKLGFLWGVGGIVFLLGDVFMGGVCSVIVLFEVKVGIGVLYESMVYLGK